MFIISTLHCGEAPRGRVEKREILSHHSVEICKFFPHDILQKFRQINYFTKEFYCKSIWRKIIAVGENFRNFHTAVREE